MYHETIVTFYCEEQNKTKKLPFIETKPIVFNQGPEPFGALANFQGNIKMIKNKIKQALKQLMYQAFFFLLNSPPEQLYFSLANQKNLDM